MKCWLLVKRNNTARSPVLPSPQQLWQFCDVRRDATGLVAGEPLHRHAAAVLVFKIYIGECLTVRVPKAKALGGFVNGPRRWEAEGCLAYAALRVQRLAPQSSSASRFTAGARRVLDLEPVVRAAGGVR
jgi:hypothetical protein